MLDYLTHSSGGEDGRCPGGVSNLRPQRDVHTCSTPAESAAIRQLWVQTEAETGRNKHGPSRLDRDPKSRP